MAAQRTEVRKQVKAEHTRMRPVLCGGGCHMAVFLKSLTHLESSLLLSPSWWVGLFLLLDLVQYRGLWSWITQTQSSEKEAF
jgi:hypothetical protein